MSFLSMTAIQRLGALALVFALAGCTWLGGGAGGSDGATSTIRVGADRALFGVGIVEHAQALFEHRSPLRLEITYDLSVPLAEAAARGELDLILLASDRDFERLESEGIAARSGTWAHEELVYIGPPDDPVRAHGSQTPPELLKNISRSSYLFLKPEHGSAEWVRFSELFKLAGDPQESTGFVPANREGIALVKKVVADRAFGLVLRSAIIRSAAEGTAPHRVYQEGLPGLVLRIRAIEIHAAKTKRPERPELYDFLMGPEGLGIVERFGVDRFGYPPYAPGDPPEGQGASVPGR